MDLVKVRMPNYIHVFLDNGVCTVVCVNPNVENYTHVHDKIYGEYCASLRLALF